MQINKKLYLPFLLLILMPLSSVQSQLSELSDLILSDLTKQTVDKTAAPTVEEEQQKLLEGRTIDFEDENYGYTGGKNFINPPQEKFFDEPLKYFGYSFFINAPTTFAPATEIPIPPDYLLGPGDTLKIILFGNKNNVHNNLEIVREGDIFLPGIGPIAIAGLSFKDAKATIQQMVASQFIGTEARITLGKLRSINIFVLGDSYQPGRYTVSALSTFINAIFISGGINQTGSLRKIQLKRKGKVVSTFDFYDLLLDGDTSGDIRLMEGDVVFIPPITKTVGISGEVGRPAIYELKESETLKDLIGYAGNLQPKADLFSANLQRVDSSVNGFRLIPVDLNDSSLASFELKNGDVLQIHSVVDNLSNAILMTGHAQQPGFFPWHEGMRIGDLVRSSNDLLSMTDLSYVLIKREDELNQNYQFLQFDLEEIFKNDASDSNLLLFEKDEVIFFPSLLTPKQITTRLIQDKYLFENDQLVLEDDEWNTLLYLRKSLMEAKLSVKESGELQSATERIRSTGVGISEDNQDIRRYYEYSIYDYCAIPEDLAIKVIESTGFRTKKSISWKELEKLASPADITNLKRQIENERIQSKDSDGDAEEISPIITNLCRRQLLDPLIEVINRQIKPRKQVSTISLYGSVHFPGMYPLTQGMILEDAIKAAGGLKNATYGSEIEISRSTKTGKKFSILNSVVSLSDTQAMQTTLEEMDVINFKQISTNAGSVEITGEIFFAGIYPITENQTLNELIQRAGGITQYGSLKAAIFQRKALQEAEFDRLKTAKNELRRKMIFSAQSASIGREEGSLDGGSIEQLSAILAIDEEEEALGRLIIDLESIMKGLETNVILENGDSLHIPKIRQSISVIGEVFVENSHLYKNNLNIDDYVNLSGGVTSFADKNSIYLIKSDGRVISPSQITGKGFFRRDQNEVMPGDTIVVPLQVQPFSALKATSEITQIFYQMALAAAAVNSF